MSKVYGNRNQILPFLILLIIAPQIFAQSAISKLPSVFKRQTPTIATGKRNYQTHEKVDIVGSDFMSYERVRMSVKQVDINLKEEILLSNWDVYADSKGSIVTEWIILDVESAGTDFVIEGKGGITGFSYRTVISTDPLAGEAVNIDQCANTDATPQTLNCPPSAGTGWVNGNVNANKAAYFEGDSVAYRAKFSDLVPGNSYTWRIGYDTTESGINTIDYLTTYNRTISNANPCANGAVANGFCTAGAPTSVIGIPTDPNVTNGRDTINGTSDDIVQVPGVFSMWDAQLTGVSGYTYDPGFPAGNIQTYVDVTFTAGTGTTAVLAWGGHIATRDDWGQSFGAINRTGSPFHTRNEGLTNNTDMTTCCGGQQELQLAIGAVTPTATIIIIKHATPPSLFGFGFSTTNLNPGAFTMVDDQIGSDPVQRFTGITTFDTKNITETNSGGYTLQSIVCTVDVAGTPATPAPVIAGMGVNIDITSGAQVTCTFNNDFLTAAAVTVSGRVFDSAGNGLSRATVSVTDPNGNQRTVLTNQFGYYRIYEIEAGDGYVFNVRHKGYTFPTRLINVNDNLTGINFSAQ